jgi:hypothetical protein
MITRENGLGKGKIDKKSTQVQITECKSELTWPQKARTLTPRQPRYRDCKRKSSFFPVAYH